MKKILLAFDGSHFSSGAFEFARQLHELEPVLVTGAFLPQAQTTNAWSYADGMTAPMFIPLADSMDDERLKASVEKFETLCQKNGMEYRVHEDRYDFALPELREETRFADLLIIGSEVFYQQMGNTINEYLQDVLHTAECPVIVVPEKFEFPTSVILSYDGSSSSVYAIKQFSYVLPALSEKPAILVYAEDGGDNEVPKQSNIEELAARHFKDLTLMKLDMPPEKYFSTWMENRKGALLVSGAFGRSGFSQLFKKSFIADIIANRHLPVFIAHK
ncbi:MAG: universal stress protein [Chitinophagaceae bacterium]|jgi:nucleotide-binding universal stress UspA family protein|nr:universal stress protein [Chitinophagaceae bacterium]